jgi:DNA-binding transcriptional regulator YdaS (Cro superfamily)
MRTAGSIIDELGGTGEVAAALVLSDSTVSSWRSRPRGIPPEHWTALVRVAAERGKAEITLETLAELIARDPAEARA